MELDTLKVWWIVRVATERIIIQLVLEVVVLLTSLDMNLQTHNQHHCGRKNCITNSSPTIIGWMLDNFNIEVVIGRFGTLAMNLIIVDCV